MSLFGAVPTPLLGQEIASASSAHVTTVKTLPDFFFSGVELFLLFCVGETEALERFSNLFRATQKGVRMTSPFALQSWGLKTA